MERWSAAVQNGGVIYLDHAATTPLCPAAREAVQEVVASGLAGANPSSPHRPGRRARALLDEARDTVAGLLGVEAGELIFTSGGTEADNLALMGAARAVRRERGRRGLVVSAIEHHAVLEAARALEREGFAVEWAGCDARGRVPPEAVEEAIRRLEARGERPGVVALMLVNNEVGTLQPVAEAAEVAHRAGALLMTDAVQGAFVEALSPKQLGCDLLTLSAHKFGGPQGAGAVYVRRGIPFDPLGYGGGQERGLRPGTENVLGIVGMAAAFAWARRERAAVEGHKRRLEARLLRRLAEQGLQVAVNGAEAPRIPGLMSLYVPGVEAETLLVELDMAGVACSYGSACSSGSMRPSHVLQAMGLPPERVRGSIRVSIGATNTPEEMDEAAGRMARAVRRLTGAPRPVEAAEVAGP